MAGRATSGRSRPARPPVPPVRSRQVGARVTGPLVARTELSTDRPPVVGAAVGRVRRFVRRWGWRAYAIPVLVLFTVAVLIDLAVHPPVPTSSTTAADVAGSSAVPSAAAPQLPDAAAPAEGDAEPSAEPDAPDVVGAEPFVEQGAGTLTVLDGGSDVYGAGPLQRFIVEVEDGTGVDGGPFATAVETTLSDPRSWGNDGQRSFQRVGAAAAAGNEFDFRVSLVSPGSMERYCPGVGTGGYTSCRYGDRAVINLARWATAVPDYEGDIATYRQYVVNHEVGHVLGNGHQPCPGAGQPAPVMQQQTLGLEGCTRNAWPFP